MTSLGSLSLNFTGIFSSKSEDGTKCAHENNFVADHCKSIKSYLYSSKKIFHVFKKIHLIQIYLLVS